MPNSFVYPVKSLLQGIQPVEPEAEDPVAESSNARPRRSNSGSSSQKPGSLPVQLKRHKTSANGPNFKHFPSQGHPSPPQSFAQNPAAKSHPTSTAASPTLPSVDSLATNPLSHTSADSDPRHPPALPVIIRDAFSSENSSSSSLGVHFEAEEKDDLPWNPAELGVVYLDSSGSSQGSSRQSMPSTDPHSCSSSRGRSTSPYQTAEETLNSTDSGQDYRDSSSLAAPPPEPNWMTVKFRHVQDEDGHHVVIGREGKLMRCEDEPIRAPGAVQGFGVLIAVEELDETLVVRQVSENTTELLGLSPHYLFSLECFTDILPESQASLLWDNIQFLSEPDPNSTEDEQDFPQVFLLSGWSEGSSPTSAENAPGRKTWTCWCAVHRPPSPPGVLSSKNLIIIEFELERDLLNPLYPPPVINSSGSSSSGSTGTSSSSSGTSNGQGNSTDGSERTLVSADAAAASSLSLASDDMPTPGESNRNLDNATIMSVQAQPASEPTRTDTLGPVSAESGIAGLDGEKGWVPNTEDIMESTISRSKPLPALERLRRAMRLASDPNPRTSSPDDGADTLRGRRARRRAALEAEPGGSRTGVGMMDVFAVLAQINEQLGAAPDLEAFLKVLVGVIKDLTQFHRVLVYQFDEMWNGQVVAELVDWSMTHDLYRGLHFPAGDIPAQARELYSINKVRILYDRSQPTARLVARSKEDLDVPLNMTHCYLRAMSPIHIKYLGNMGVRASMSVSIMAFGTLWGLVACHSYGNHGMRVSFPVRQMLRLLSQSISRNIERLSYAQRLHTRKLINTISSERHPTGYIVSNADDLLGLFDADFGILVIGDGAKILGPNQHGQEILIMAEYLRLKQFNTIQVSHAVTHDYPDLIISTGLEVVAGLLYVPLSSGGTDFIAFLRKGQPRSVHWAGKPHKPGAGESATLEPRTSFKIWSEIVAGRCRTWTDEQLETAGVLALVYGKFIEVWRQKESALNTTRLTNLLLSNARHEVRTPLNHIINYLEMALNGSLDTETRDNLSRSHAASKNLLFTINDLLDLTRLESGNETTFNEPFDLPHTVEEAAYSYRNEAVRRKIDFKIDTANCPNTVVGDAKKIRTIVQNLSANALNYTSSGRIVVQCVRFDEPEGLRGPKQTAVEIVVSDTGCGISPPKLESILREFEQVESSEQKTGGEAGVGLGLAVVARIIEQLGGQLRVESQVNQGSRFSILLPFSIPPEGSETSSSRSSNQSSSASLRIRSQSQSLNSGSEIDSLVEALTSNHMSPSNSSKGSSPGPSEQNALPSPNISRPGTFEVTDSNVPVRPIKMDEFELEPSSLRSRTSRSKLKRFPSSHRSTRPENETASEEKRPVVKLRILIVEDNDFNRLILAKRLRMDGHDVVNTINGQEGLDTVRTDREFDAVLMDINMPILNGFEASEQIRQIEMAEELERDNSQRRLSHQLNGRIPIFAVSASLIEDHRDKLASAGMDGWILKPIDHKRLGVILQGVTDPVQRESDRYHPGCNWERGGWLTTEKSTS